MRRSCENAPTSVPDRRNVTSRFVFGSVWSPSAGPKMLVPVNEARTLFELSRNSSVL